MIFGRTLDYKEVMNNCSVYAKDAVIQIPCENIIILNSVSDYQHNF